MTLSHEDVRELAGRAASLYERLGPAYQPIAPAGGPPPVSARVADWIERVAKGDEAHFQKRLEWDGLTPASAEALLAGVRLREDAAVPSWAQRLQEALDVCRELADFTPDTRHAAAPFTSADDPIPFEDLFIPFVVQAARGLEAREGEAWRRLSAAARANTQRALLRALSRTAGATLALEFSTYVAVSASRGRGEPDEHYRAFVRDLSHGGLASLLKQYPVLGRMLGRTNELWIAFIGDFLRHLGEDAVDVERMFGGGTPLGSVTALGLDMSDAHHGGKSVLRVTFENGTTCYYKPKNIDSDRAFNNLLQWANETGGMPPLRVERLMGRRDHGWAEEAVAAPCEDEAAARRYYERIGMLLCVLYVLGANDCNCENIIASGDQPILVDTETLFHPLANAMQEQDPWGAAMIADQEIFFDSVLRVGMLPRWTPGPDGARADLSGLGGANGDRGQYRAKIWHDINTDAMRYEWTWIPLKQRVVRIGDRPAYAEAYVAEISRGFEAMYRFVLAHASEVLAVMGSDETLGDLPQRFLVRNTHTYTGLIERLLLPQHLTDGMAASIQAEALARRFLYADQKPFAWPIIPFESDAVLQLDVPKFAFAPSDDALRFPPHGVIDAFFAETGLAAVKRRITALSSSDLARQLGFIRCSFNDTNGTNGTNGANGADAAVATRAEPRRSDGRLTRAEALEEAAAIADQLRRAAIHGGDGTVTWITYGYQMDAQFYQVQPMGLNLYDGVCGPGVFLAAVERATGGDGLRSLALATFKSFDDISSKEIQHRLLREGIGAGLGLASIVYALLKTGELLGEDHLITRAEQMAALITPGAIAADKRLDVVGGAAGCALVLAALYRTRPVDVIAELAVACGTHLLNTSTVSEDGLRSWRTIHGKRLAGFSHGAAGMAYALCRVFELSREARFRDAAAEACAFERSLYSEPERNWLNMLAPLKDGGYACWNSWCHGAPGIGLGRLGGLGVLDTPSVREDIARSLACAGALPLNEVHHLCCGSLGRLDVLLEAGDTLGDSTCITQAALMAGRVVDEARTRGSYAGTVQAGVLVPAFFQGVSGVGYQLLRVSEPKTLPSVLRYA